MAYNLPQVPDIKIGTPTQDPMWKQLLSTVIRGTLSDVWIEARRERASEAVSLYEGWSATASQALKSTNVDDIQDTLDNFLLLQGEHPEGSDNWNRLGGMVGALEKKQDQLESLHELSMEKAELTGIYESHKDLASNILQHNPHDKAFIVEAINDLKEDRSALVMGEEFQKGFEEQAEAYRGYDPEKALHQQSKELDKIVEKYKPLLKGQLKPGFKWSSDLKLEVIVSEADPNLLKGTALEGEKDDYFEVVDDKAVIRTETIDEQDYWRNLERMKQEEIDAVVKKYGVEDYLTFKESEDETRASFMSDESDPLKLRVIKGMDQLLTVLEQQKGVADIHTGWDKSILTFENELDILKTKGGDIFTGEAPKLIDELNQRFLDSKGYLGKAALSQIDNIRDEMNIWTGGYNALNTIEKIRKTGLSSEAAMARLNLSAEVIASGMATENKSEIAKGISNLNAVITEERMYKTSQRQLIGKSIKSFEKGVSSAFLLQANVLGEEFGIGPKAPEEAKKYIPDKFLQGPNALNQNPASMGRNFKFDNAADAIKYKPMVAEQLAKMVRASDMEGFSDKEKKELNGLINNIIKKTGDHESSDRLYEILRARGDDHKLDFVWNVFSDEKNREEIKSRSIYKKYLEMYRIIYEGLALGQERFGSEYGYEQILGTGSGGVVGQDEMQKLLGVL
tara:strand:- start:524 stop:2566 length:2043 start_codon:yes stop_codon:yes gene_type:complete